MIPSFEFSGKVISPYLICVVSGILTVLLVLYFMARKAKLDDIDMMFIMLYAFVGVAIGGCLLFGLTNIKYIISLFANYDKIPTFGEFARLLFKAFQGSVFYGGLIGALLALYLYRKKKGLSRRYTDLGTIGIPLFHVFGRLGCFLSGCCYGIECDFGVIYRYAPLEEVNGVPRLPVQLFEVVFNLILVIVLIYFFRKKKYESWLMQIYLYAYPIFRFVIEFFRGDALRGFFWIFSTSQWISIILIIANTAVILRRRRNADNEA